MVSKVDYHARNRPSCARCGCSFLMGMCWNSWQHCIEWVGKFYVGCNNVHIVLNLCSINHYFFLQCTGDWKNISCMWYCANNSIYLLFRALECLRECIYILYKLSLFFIYLILLFCVICTFSSDNWYLLPPSLCAELRELPNLVFRMNWCIRYRV